MDRDKEDVRENFLKNVKEHEMNIIIDRDVYRNIRFGKPGSSVYHFALTTWPGYLAVSGDMGEWVFSRLTDMFKFFRQPEKMEDLYINLGYWHEKLRAEPRHGGSREFSRDAFEDAVKTAYEYMTEDREEEYEGQHKELWEALEDEVLSAEDDSYAAYSAAYDFSFQGTPPRTKDSTYESLRWEENKTRTFRLDDFFEYDLKRYTYGFIWICYAIVWGIQQYDAIKENQETAVT